MAAPQKPAPTVPEQAFHALHSAEIVGNAFARQYYTILQQSPTLVYRFYQDASKMGRAEDGSIMGSTTTMDAINEKIQSYGSLRADIKFVDAQESYNGGVIVLVTGSMVNDDDSRRGFTQTFFLAPQEKGYYVLNDIFRYVEDDPGDNEDEDGGSTPASLSQEEDPPVPENHICDQSNGEVYNPCENGEVPVKEEKEEVRVQEKELVDEVAEKAPQASWVVVESDAEVEDTSKKSYASIVMKDGPASISSHAHLKSVSKVQDRQVSVAPACVSVAVAPSPNAEIVDVDNNQVLKGEGHSIHMKNLPYYVPYSLVEEVFRRFGPIKSGGIQILHSKGFCYGFVEYETAAAAQSAIEASPITIDGHRVVIEEKRSTFTRASGNSFGGNNRGRYPSGRGGSGFRGEGGRGGRGGGYGGGRDYGRGESNKNDLGGRGSGRGYQNRSEGYSRSDQTGNVSGRINRGGGSGHVSTKAQKVSAQV